MSSPKFSLSMQCSKPSATVLYLTVSLQKTKDLSVEILTKTFVTQAFALLFFFQQAFCQSSLSCSLTWWQISRFCPWFLSPGSPFSHCTVSYVWVQIAVHVMPVFFPAACYVRLNLLCLGRNSFFTSRKMRKKSQHLYSGRDFSHRKGH